jgi:hypothetical protein
MVTKQLEPWEFGSCFSFSHLLKGVGRGDKEAPEGLVLLDAWIPPTAWGPQTLRNFLFSCHLVRCFLCAFQHGLLGL